MKTDSVRSRLWPNDDDFVQERKAEIKSVDVLLDEVKEIRDHLLKEVKDKCGSINGAGTKHNLGPGIYFRGQRKEEYDLLPSVGRKKQKTRNPWSYCGRELEELTEIQERNLLHRFRRRSYRHFGRLLSWWEALFLARHYGLPTRLLDWTDNPLVALHFASEYPEYKKEPDKNGAVWAIVRFPSEGDDLNVLSCKGTLLEDEDYKHGKEFKFAIKGVKIVYPFDNNGRLIAQQGVFTIQEDPWTALNYFRPSNFEKENFDIFRIYKWIVPKDKRYDIVGKLYDHGINHQVLFPDINGLAEGILRTEIIRSGAQIK